MKPTTKLRLGSLAFLVFAGSVGVVRGQEPPPPVADADDAAPTSPDGAPRPGNGLKKLSAPPDDEVGADDEPEIEFGFDDFDDNALSISEAEPIDMIEVLRLRDTEELDLWERFLIHLADNGQRELISELGFDDALTTVDFSQGDPIRGILFRSWPDLVALDDALSEVATSSSARDRLLEPERFDQLYARAKTLEEADDPFVQPYGIYYLATLDELRATGQTGDERLATLRAVRARLEWLAASRDFLPLDEVHERLAAVYEQLGDDTQAILEYQFCLTELPSERAVDRERVTESLRSIRDASQHPGPLNESEGRMKKLAGRLEEPDPGEETQGEQKRLETVLEKVAKLLERAEDAGGAQAAQAGQMGQRSSLRQRQQMRQLATEAAQRMRQQGQQGQQGRQGQQGQQGQQGRQGQQGQQQQQGEQARRNQDKNGKANGRAEGENLRDDVARDRKAWGRVNQRDVERSLQGVWDKIPPRYRHVVTQYFRDLAEVDG